MPTHPHPHTHTHTHTPHTIRAQSAAGELSSSSRYNPLPRRRGGRNSVVHIQFVACAFTPFSDHPGIADGGAVDLEPGSAPYMYIGVLY